MPFVIFRCVTDEGWLAGVIELELKKNKKFSIIIQSGLEHRQIWAEISAKSKLWSLESQLYGTSYSLSLDRITFGHSSIISKEYKIFSKDR